MERDITPKLTAAEVGFLWSHYMGNSLKAPMTWDALPVGAMWILKYTYGRFWLYTAVQTVGGLVLIMLVQPLLHRRRREGAVA